MVRNLPVNAGDAGSFPGSGRSLGEGRSLAGYGPWGHRELDMTYRLNENNFKCIECFYKVFREDN